MRRTGFRPDIAPWNTIEASAQRTARSLPHGIVRTSCPLSWIELVTEVPVGSSLRIAPAIVDFPQPDSPATPTTSPASTSSETPRRAGREPPATRYETARSRISNSAMSAPLRKARVEDAFERPAAHVERPHHHHDGEAG